MILRKQVWCELKGDSLDLTVGELAMEKAVDQSQKGLRGYDHF